MKNKKVRFIDLNIGNDVWVLPKREDQNPRPAVSIFEGLTRGQKPRIWLKGYVLKGYDFEIDEATFTAWKTTVQDNTYNSFYLYTSKADAFKEYAKRLVKVTAYLKNKRNKVQEDIKAHFDEIIECNDIILDAQFNEL